MSGELGPVQIGAREIYDLVVATNSEVIGVRAEIARMSDADAAARHRLDRHEDRLGQLERKVWALPSAATVIALAALILPHLP